MRTTLIIDDDVLAAVRELARRQRRSAGKVMSDLARQALGSNANLGGVRNGITLLPTRSGAVPVTPEMIRMLDSETP